jgi:hypothetical protein
MLCSKLWEDVDNESFVFNDEEIYFYDSRGRPTTSLFVVVDEEQESPRWRGLEWQVEMQNRHVLERHLLNQDREISYSAFLEHYAHMYKLRDYWSFCDEQN